MPISSVDLWNDAVGSTVKCFVLPANDFYRQAYNNPDANYLPADWMQPSFDDSSWGGVVNPDGITLESGLGPYTGSSSVPGIWADVTGSGSTESVAFRHSVMVPAGNVTGLTIDLWFQSFVVDRFNFQNSFQLQYSSPPFGGVVNYGYVTTYRFINGELSNFSYSDAQKIVPGAINTFALWFTRPWPITSCGGSVTEQLAGCVVAPVWATPAFVGWRIHLEYSTPIPDYPPVETRTIVGPWGFGGSARGGTVLPGGPLEVQHAIGWDGSGPALAGLDGETPYSTWAMSQLVPPVTEFDSYGSYQLHDSIGGGTATLFDSVAQGFNAQWTTLEWIRIGLQVGSFVTGGRAWPTGITAVCDIYTDLNGLPDAPIAEATVDLGTVVSVDGPVCFQFIPPVTLIPGTNYWIILRFVGPYTDSSTGPWFLLRTTFWTCNGPPYPASVNPPVYGLPWQGYQAMVAGSDGVWKQMTSQFVAPGPCTNTTQPDLAAVWDMSIGGEGLALALTHTIVSCSPNGMGTGGRIDPNLGAFPNALVMSGWNVDGPVATLPIGAFGKFANDLNLMGFYTDSLGSAWAIGSWYNQATGSYSWGTVLASRTIGLGDWPWPDFVDPVSGRSLSILSGRAVMQPGGMIVTVLHTLTFDPVTFDRIDQLWLQTLNGFSYSTPVDLNGSEVLDLINDSQGSTHVFFSTQSPRGHPYCHLIVYSDGTVTPSFSWDCGVASGYGTLEPVSGGVIFPYVSKSGCFFAVVFKPDGTGPDYQELPTVADFASGQRVPNSDSIFPPNHGTIVALLFVGNTGYMFCQDVIGISVAKFDNGTWTGLASWSTDPDMSNLFSLPGQSGLTANYIASRSQIGVAYSVASYNFFEWFPDNLSYPPFFPTGCGPQPCLGGGVSGGAQLIG